METSTRYCEKYLAYNKTLLFVLLVLINISIFIANNKYVVTDKLYYNSLIEQLSMERIDSIIHENRKWQYLTVLFIPLVLLIKIGFTAFCLYVGLSFAGLQNSFAELFNISMKAELVFIVASILKFLINILTHRVEVFDDLNNYPLSLISITGTKGIYPWLTYPLQTLNLFELIYWLALAKGLEVTFSRGYSSSLVLVLSSYVIGLVIWILFVMLLTMQFT
jgi:hypothetical protein